MEKHLKIALIAYFSVFTYPLLANDKTAERQFTFTVGAIGSARPFGITEALARLVGMEIANLTQKDVPIKLITGGMPGIPDSVADGFVRNSWTLTDRLAECVHLIPRYEWDFYNVVEELETIDGAQQSVKRRVKVYATTKARMEWYGNTMRDRQKVFGHLSEATVMIEGGTGAFYEAIFALSQGTQVIPVPNTSPFANLVYRVITEAPGTTSVYEDCLALFDESKYYPNPKDREDERRVFEELYQQIATKHDANRAALVKNLWQALDPVTKAETWRLGNTTSIEAAAENIVYRYVLPLLTSARADFMRKNFKFNEEVNRFKNYMILDRKNPAVTISVMGASQHRFAKMQNLSALLSAGLVKIVRELRNELNFDFDVVIVPGAVPDGPPNTLSVNYWALAQDLLGTDRSIVHIRTIDQWFYRDQNGNPLYPTAPGDVLRLGERIIDLPSILANAVDIVTGIGGSEFTVNELVEASKAKKPFVFIPNSSPYLMAYHDSLVGEKVDHESIIDKVPLPYPYTNEAMRTLLRRAHEFRAISATCWKEQKSWDNLPSDVREFNFSEETSPEAAQKISKIAEWFVGQLKPKIRAVAERLLDTKKIHQPAN